MYTLNDNNIFLIFLKELLTPDQTKPLRPSVSPRNSPGLHKESSVSSLKEALLSGSQIYNEGKTNSSLPPGPGLGPGSNVGPSPGMVRSPVLGTSPGIGPSPVPVSRVSYPGNSSPFLGISDVRDRLSPMTPSMVIPPGQAQTPRLSSPVGIIEPNDSSLLAPPPQQPTPPIENRAVKSPFDNINSSTVTRQPSPFEMDSILGGLKENEPRNGKTVSPINNNDQINSPVSSIGGSSPRLRKVCTVPILHLYLYSEPSIKVTSYKGHRTTRGTFLVPFRFFIMLSLTKDTSIKKTSLLVPMVSIIERFHCTPFVNP